VAVDAFPKVCFAFPHDAPTTRVWGACDEVRLEAGLPPNLCTLTVPKHEFDKFSGDYDRQGNLELYWSSAVTPDVVLTGWSMDHVEDSIVGKRPGDPAAQILEKRLVLTDRRWEFLDYRGGAAFFGLVNKARADGKGVENVSNGFPETGATYYGLVNKLRTRLQYASGLTALSETLPAGLDIADAKPKDLKWDGIHAPSEIARLAAEAEATWILRTDATYWIEMLGAGTLPDLPSGDLLPTDPATSRDRRSGTVVVTSAPERIVVQETLYGMKPGASGPGWEYVAYDTDGQLYPLTETGHFWGAGLDGAKALVRSGFAGLSGDALALAHAGLFKIVRLVGKTGDDPIPRSRYLPILARGSQVLDEGSEMQRPVPVRVKAEVARPVNGLWSNAAGPIYVAPFTVDNAQGLITFPTLLGKVASDGVRSPAAWFEPLTASDDLAVEFGHESRECAAGATPWKDYFTVGYRRDGETVEELTDEELATALGSGGSDVRIINFPSLMAYRNGDTILNETELKAHAVKVAERILASEEAPKTYRYKGLHDVSPSGAVLAVRWRPRDGVTEFDWKTAHVSKNRYRDKEALFGKARTVASTALASDDAPRQVAHGGRDWAAPQAAMPGGLPETDLAPLAFAVVTARRNHANAAWTDFVADDFISHVLAHPCRSDGTVVVAGTTLYLKATAWRSPLAATGYESIQVDDVVAYLPGDGKEEVPGAAETYFDGYLVPNAGADGATLTARVID
jgi:hypothetical protein